MREREREEGRERRKEGGKRKRGRGGGGMEGVPWECSHVFRDIQLEIIRTDGLVDSLT